jgi:hypothetical protein
MDIATILGLVVGVLVVLKMAGASTVLYQAPSLLLVVAGGVAAMLIAFPLRESLNVFFNEAVLPSLLIERMVGFAETARREGILAIQSGDNPRIVEHKLAVFLASQYRPSPKRMAPPPPPAEDHARENLEIFISEKQEMVLRLVREVVQAHAAENKQKAKVEEIADKVERGELSIVALLALLSSGVRNEIMQQI